MITAHHKPSLSCDDPAFGATATRRLYDLARRVAQSHCTVLISGESGTGKEVLARYIHAQSARHAAPFVAVNCAAIPEHMLEALLFGWERGAFTGAHNAHAGKFEQAQNGTLLLDEVSEMPPGLQAKLLRVLQEQEVERLGARDPIALDVRVLATTNRRLREEVSAGRFREDLYYRLNVFPLALSPLRDRREDILPLAMSLLARHSVPGERVPAIKAEAAVLLLAYRWPGNARELENVMQRALLLCEGDVIAAEHISFEPLAELAGPVLSEAARNTAGRQDPAPPRALARPAVRADFAGSMAAAEQQILLEALRRSSGSRQRVAEQLGISPRTLRYKLARLRAAGVDLDGAERVA
ncbi:MAG TPA: sigma-54 dependent transcriptional regulator [Steroidobacteraceae bacterium]|nr:sigma-54 dependent transcriptional regulator [Steroidobacteraceae bacterium]